MDPGKSGTRETEWTPETGPKTGTPTIYPVSSWSGCRAFVDLFSGEEYTGQKKSPAMGEMTRDGNNLEVIVLLLLL